MPWAMTVVGSVMLDDVRTGVHTATRQLGGSAMYATLAARRFTHVNTVGVVGVNVQVLPAGWGGSQGPLVKS